MGQRSREPLAKYSREGDRCVTRGASAGSNPVAKQESAHDQISQRTVCMKKTRLASLTTIALLGGHGTIFLAAYDDRIRASACNCGGSFFRHNPRVEAWSRDHWYVYFKPVREGLLRKEMPPIDFHEIIALIAPRAFLDLSGLNDGHGPTQRQRLLMLMKVMAVYELEDSAENFGFYAHGRGHSVAHESRQLIYGFMDSHLKPPEATRTRLVDKVE